jgi:hypothetical protein
MGLLGRRGSRLHAARAGSWRRSLLGFTAALMPALLIGSQAVGQAPAAAASPSFAFNWAGEPATPQAWVPAAANDWDLLESNGGAGDTTVRMGTFQGSHGTDCAAPPAAHPISLLIDTAYVCKDHMMTAPNDGAVFFTPNQLVDFSHGTATITWQVSTFRYSSRDWWEIWLTPFSENFAAPTDTAPVFEGPPNDAIHFQMEQKDGCSIGQAGPNWTDANTGAHIGTTFSYNVFRGGNEAESGGDGPCMEDLAGGPSSKTRSTFELDVSPGHVKLGMTGASGAGTWVDRNLTLPFNQAVVTWAHRSYNPSKACGFDGTCGPNTFHWSNVSVSPSLPFTMLRPIGNGSVHGSTNTTVTLPQPAPANSFLRFSAFGTIKVSYDHGAWVSPHMQDTGWRAEGASNYLTPVPAGTRTISFQGTSRGGATWWIDDVAVWASTAPTTLPVQTSPPATTPTPTAPPPTQAPAPTPTPSTAPVKTPPPVRHEVHVPWWMMFVRGWVTWWQLRH